MSNVLDDPNPLNKPSSCLLCPLIKAPGPVWGEGPKDAKIMLVGEAPGEEEAALLRPFVGGSGRVLNKLLEHAQIDRREVFTTNVVKCRPTAHGSNGRIINRQPTETEIRTCAKFLVSELDTVRPAVTIALGNVPLHTLTSTRKGILSMRSVPIEGPRRKDGEAERYKIVGTLHPAAVMRSQDYWPAVVFDLHRAKTESAFPAIVRRPWKHVIHARLSDVGEYLRRRIRERGHYFHDLETTGLNAHTDTVRCFGVAADPEEIFCFDWTGDVQQFVSDIHSDESLITVGQNSEGFDIPFQETKGFKFKGKTYDTMIGWHLLNSALPKDLGFIGASVTDELYWKDDTMYRSGEDALQVGCCKDVHATGMAYLRQIEELESLGQKDLYFNHIMPLQPVLRAMTRRGVRKDQRLMVLKSRQLNAQADEMEVRLKKGLGDASFQVNSPKQLQELLYTRMGLPEQRNPSRDGGSKPTVDAEALERLADIVKNDVRYQHLHPIFALIRGIRTFRKMDSTFICCPQDERGFIHGSFSSAKAANGRLNSYNPNMQNFPIEARDIIIPDDDDHVLVARDWSQIEWKVAMALSGDKNGLDALAAGRDAHKDSYSKAFIREYDSVTKSERDIAKSINYGLLYGRGLESLVEGRSTHGGSAKDGAIPMDRAVAYKDAFLSTFSQYASYRKHIEMTVKKHHFFATPWGRRRWWFTTNQMPEAYNFPISGSAAHMMYEALIELEAQLPKGAELRLSVHDEVVVHSSKEQKVLQQTLECTRDVMEKTFPLLTEGSMYPDIVRHYYPNGWHCASDVHIGTNLKMTKGSTKEDLLAEEELLKHLGVTP